MLWREPNPIPVPEVLKAFVGGHPLVAERLVRAGIFDVEEAKAFLDPQNYRPSSPFELPDMQPAVDRLNLAVRSAEPILIWGDFDVDGQTATALLFSALQKLGANVRYHVPLRNGEGHGMFLPRLREWLGQGIRLIITCDTGITSHDAVDLARSSGVDVIITDHHLLGETLPEALAVINPMRLPAGHKLRDLPGVGAAYQLIKALSGDRNQDELLDLVALGIVGDVATQRNDTRHLLQRGIAAMRISSRPGLQALLNVADIDQLALNESDIGFGLAPRLNAQGRLGDAKESVELLSTSDKGRAAELANQLEGMNARRKLESRMIEDGARSLIERDPSLLEYAAIVLSSPDWSGGVVGIVANRLAETYQKPVVLLSEEGDKAFGSARSVAGVNITEAMRACRDLLIKFGGHAMAAGLTLQRDNILDFRRSLSRVVREMAAKVTEEPELQIDGYLNLSEINIDLVEDLRRLAPFGNGNPPLTLASGNLRIARKKKLGRRGDHLELIVEDEKGAQRRVLWWNAGDEATPEGRFDLAYNLRISRYKDRPESILELIDLRLIDAYAEISTAEALFEIENFRDHPNLKEKLSEVLEANPDAVVWREADSTVDGSNRNELKPAQTLIVWTAPPGPDEWKNALDAVDPRRVVVFGITPSEQTLEMFLQRMGGLLKFAINSKAGETTIGELAAATAQRYDAVRYALIWFHETGRLAIDIRSGGSVLVKRRADSTEITEAPQLEKLLKSVIEETNIYRRKWTPS